MNCKFIFSLILYSQFLEILNAFYYIASIHLKHSSEYPLIKQKHFEVFVTTCIKGYLLIPNVKSSVKNLFVFAKKDLTVNITCCTGASCTLSLIYTANLKSGSKSFITYLEIYLH